VGPIWAELKVKKWVVEWKKDVKEWDEGKMSHGKVMLGRRIEIQKLNLRAGTRRTSVQETENGAKFGFGCTIPQRTNQERPGREAPLGGGRVV